MPPELEHVIVSTPDSLGGSARLIGTRVPVQALLDNFLLHHSLSYFLEGYPDVIKEQAEAVMRWQQNTARTAFDMAATA